MFYFKYERMGSMTDYNSWGQEYLREAETLRKHIQAARAEKGYDISGARARRINMLHSMYLECIVTGHLLQKRGSGAKP